MSSGFLTISRGLYCTVLAFLGLVMISHAQTDSITYNSTCVNYKIEFGSSVFNKIDFPDKVAWNFGDPASGFYNTAATKFPTHAFSAPGNYTITLTVVLSWRYDKFEGHHPGHYARCV